MICDWLPNLKFFFYMITWQNSLFLSIIVQWKSWFFSWPFDKIRLFSPWPLAESWFFLRLIDKIWVFFLSDWQKFRLSFSSDWKSLQIFLWLFHEICDRLAKFTFFQLLIDEIYEYIYIYTYFYFVTEFLFCGFAKSSKK